MCASARMKRDGRRSRVGVSLVSWCDACWSARRAGLSGFYTGPICFPVPPHPTVAAFRWGPRAAGAGGSLPMNGEAYSPRGRRSVCGRRNSLPAPCRGAPQRRSASARVPPRGTRPRRARRRRSAMDARTRGRHLVPPRTRAVAAGRPSAPACLFIMRASQPGTPQLLRRVRPATGPLARANGAPLPQPSPLKVGGR